MLDFIKRHKFLTAAIAIVLILIIFGSQGGKDSGEEGKEDGKKVPPVENVDKQPGSFSWQRANNPVLKPEDISVSSGGKAFSMADPFVMYDQGQFRMWYGYGALDTPGDEHSLRLRVGYAESADGKNWKASGPALTTTGTGWDRTNVETPSVVRDDNLPDGHPRKYRLYYAGIDEEINKDFGKLLEAGMGYGIGLAFSPDGRTFTKLPSAESPYGQDGLVLKPNEAKVDKDVSDFIHVADPHVVKKDGKYHMWYTSSQHAANADKVTLAIGYATSSDGIRWTKQGTVIKPTLGWEQKRADVNVGRPYVLYNNGRFEMFYDAVTEDKSNGLDNTADGIGFAWSADGKNWTKSNQPVFKTNNGKGEKRGIIVGSAAVLKDSTYYLFYPGMDPNPDHIVINLATSPKK